MSARGFTWCVGSRGRSVRELCLEGRTAYGAFVDTYERWRRRGLNLTRLAAHPRDFSRLARDLGMEIIYDYCGGVDGVLVEVWDEMRRCHRVFVHASDVAPLLGAL